MGKDKNDFRFQETVSFLADAIKTRKIKAEAALQIMAESAIATNLFWGRTYDNERLDEKTKEYVESHLESYLAGKKIPSAREATGF